ncbi:MAG TPA: prepilin-type N-terminal cleavage/methylation domain-containing protein [Pyrinomonadaceae bacterium]|nr:prepilin-type N-terminal cleavage/methylation domain-containing protein [Pyrinomonadaceae bacterium]
MRPEDHHAAEEAGFSLIELLIGMTITLVVLSVASTLIARSFGVRMREDTRSEAIADTRHALNIMTREIANAGYSLPSGLGLSSNGIVAASSNAQAIRIVTNTNRDGAINATSEDVIYQLYNDTTVTPNQRYIVRYDINAATNQSTVLANRVDNLTIRYYDQRVNYTTAAGTCDINVTTAGVTESVNRSLSKYLVISVCVTLPQIGTPNSPGYRPPSQVQLTSDVNLRNSNLILY